jgi:hypothetical protein
VFKVSSSLLGYKSETSIASDDFLAGAAETYFLAGAALNLSSLSIILIKSLFKDSSSLVISKSAILDSSNFLMG